MMAEDLPPPIHVPHCCCGGISECICSEIERCLRGWAAMDNIPRMTTAQRLWCMGEVRRQGDSTYQPSNIDFALMSDGELARTVLHAWADYVRDKG